VWWFDVTSESDDGGGLLAHGPRGDLARDLASIPVVLASEDDLVLLPRPISQEWALSLQAAGFPLPQRVVVDPGDPPASVSRGPLGRLIPWGPGRSTDRLLGPLLPRSREVALGTRHALGGKCASANLLRELHAELDDAFGPGLLPPRAFPIVVTSSAELADAVADLRGRGFTRLVIKADRSSSGRERIRLLHAHEPDEPQRGWLRKRLERDPLRVEPWFDGQVDLSLHPTGATARWLVCESDRAGRFRAAFPGRPTAAVSPEVARFLTGDGRDAMRLDRVSRILTRALRDRGVPDPVGIDTMIFRDEGELRFHPLLEVNPRWTMGRVALRLARRVDGRSVCAWIHVPVGDELARLRAALPLDLVRRGSTRKLRRGAVPTTDPETARRILTILVAAPTRAELRAALAGIALRDET
jgi:hypothetical protein